jgi:hypothetical protein
LFRGKDEAGSGMILWAMMILLILTLEGLPNQVRTYPSTALLVGLHLWDLHAFQGPPIRQEDTRRSIVPPVRPDLLEAVMKILRTPIPKDKVPLRSGARSAWHAARADVMNVERITAKSMILKIRITIHANTGHVMMIL